MAVIVQKYGGSSVASAELITKVAKKIAARTEGGNQVVVTVSAMGDTTDDLYKLAKAVNPDPNPREMDALLNTGELITCSLVAMAIEKLGKKAVSLNGKQAGIHTDHIHGQAMITSFDAARINKEMEHGKIVIVAGFQGINDDGDVTTLGRGGSNTTAVALAAGLKAEICENFTDVDGIYTADPRIVPDARRLRDIGYEEMMELATYGFRVMHPRSIELAEMYGLPILVASTFKDGPGTLIHGGKTMETKNKVRGIAHDMDVAKVTIVGVPDRAGIASQIFEALANANISVDTIVQNASIERVTDLTFTVSRTDLERAMATVEPVVKHIGAMKCVSDKRLGKVSIVGSGMQNAPGYASRMFTTLAKNNINIDLITTSEIRITCLIDEAMVKPAVLALHKAFELEKAE